MARGRIVIAIFAAVLATREARAGEGDLDAARASYDRGAAAYDAGQYPLAAMELARADEIVPNDVALELALKASVKAEDAPLAMALVDRAAKRTGSASLDAAREAAKAAMASKTGRLTVQCAPEASCTATLDGVPHPTGQPRWILAGRHRVVFDTRGRREAFSVRMDAGASVEVNATPPPPLAAVPPITSRDAPAPEPARHGLSPGWFWGGAGLTAILGGAAIASAVDTQNKHDQFLTRPSAELSNDGADAQLRTNLLGAAVAASAVATAVVGLLLVDWSSRDVEQRQGRRP